MLSPHFSFPSISSGASILCVSIDSTAYHFNSFLYKLSTVQNAARLKQSIIGLCLSPSARLCDSRAYVQWTYHVGLCYNIRLWSLVAYTRSSREQKLSRRAIGRSRSSQWETIGAMWFIYLLCASRRAIAAKVPPNRPTGLPTCGNATIHHLC